MNSERYTRQTVLPGFGPEAQEKLRQSKVLVVGAGGLGVPVLTYLNAMGVGTLGIVDNDTVSLSNLHRQVLYSEKDMGRPKVAVALEKLKAQNSETELNGHVTFLTKENALEIIKEYDLVVDASDNFPTRYLVNDACVILKKPFVYGALHGFEGQVSVFNYPDGPTYRCLFPTMPNPDEVPDCNENGVLGILPGIVGNLQALETVKVLTAVGEPLTGKLLLFDALSNSFQKISFSAKSENLKRTSLQSDYNLDCHVELSTTDSGFAERKAGPDASKAAFKIMDAETFLALIATGGIQSDNPRADSLTDDLQLIDVRTPKEFARNHMPMAKNIPLSELEARQNEIDFDEPVYVVCQSGLRSRKAIGKLITFRPDVDFINLSGGMNEIRKHGVTS
jgi:adenylyltransferase/sulfurtransferase